MNVKSSVSIKKINNLIVILFLTISVNLHAGSSSVLKGTWILEEYTEDRKSEPYHLLNLSLDVKEDKQVNGSFEYFFRWFSRVEDQKDFNTVLSSNILEFTFDSNFGGKNGKVQIKINDDCSLDWKLIKEPSGEYYAPLEAHILPDEIQVNQFCKNQYVKYKNILKTKQTLYQSPAIKTKMYLIKGDQVEVLEEKDDWLYILYRGKKDIKAWIPKSAIEPE